MVKYILGSEIVIDDPFTILTERWRHRRFRFQNEAWCHAETGCHVKSMGKREKHGVFVVILQ